MASVAVSLETDARLEPLGTALEPLYDEIGTAPVLLEVEGEEAPLEESAPEDEYPEVGMASVAVSLGAED